MPFSAASLRWWADQLYVTLGDEGEAANFGCRLNSKGGCTISIQKRGGWNKSFEAAKAIARW